VSALAEAPTLFDDLCRRGVGERPAAAQSEPSARPQRERDERAERSEPTLDALLSVRWEALQAHEVVRCLVCEEAMTPEYGVHAMPIGGRCLSCGTVLQ
jgi:hypothetical protein